MFNQYQERIFERKFTLHLHLAFSLAVQFLSTNKSAPN